MDAQLMVTVVQQHSAARAALLLSTTAVRASIANYQDRRFGLRAESDDRMPGRCRHASAGLHMLMTLPKAFQHVR
jgi:hypothetical protein